MQAEDIKKAVEGLDESTKDIVVRKLKKEFSGAIISVNKQLAADNATRDHICPKPEDIFNAFRLCSVTAARVVILGQDPFINLNEAMGLSFSVSKGVPIPPSTKNIYNCLQKCGLIKDIPKHGDLTAWAKQGVLLLNAALTTQIKKSGQHTHCWEEFTKGLLREFNGLPQRLIYILLGSNAQSYTSLIDRKHTILRWGHPSPMSTFNKTDNPKHFRYCDVFAKCNEQLIAQGNDPIDWNVEAQCEDKIVSDQDILNVLQVDDTPKEIAPTERNWQATDADPKPPTQGLLWVFTDGASRANGKANCRASWGYYMTDGISCESNCGLVPACELKGEKYQSSNNRGELLAISNALAHIDKSATKYNMIVIVSDSEYSIDSLNKWAKKWIEKGEDKKNLDIIIPAYKCLEKIRSHTIVLFNHVNSHQDEPDKSLSSWFLWKGNDIVDRLCGTVL